MSCDPELVGVFDSGIGGLTVVSAIRQRRPDLRLLYVADQAHVPYGDRSLDEVAGYAKGISTFLVAQGCGSIVMACNISSAVARDEVASAYPELPVLGVLAGGASSAVRLWEETGGPIGVLATSGTVKSGAYVSAISALAPEAEVLQVECPDLVPLIENGEEETPRMLARCMEYLEPLSDAECRIVILGCTHYPLGLSALRVAAMRLFDEEPVFVDPALAAAEALAAALDASILAQEPEPQENLRPRSTRLLTTRSVGAFRRQVRRILPDLADSIVGAVWNSAGEIEELPPPVTQGHSRHKVRSASSGLQRSLNGQPDVPSPRDT